MTTAFCDKCGLSVTLADVALVYYDSIKPNMAFPELPLRRAVCALCARQIAREFLEGTND